MRKTTTEPQNTGKLDIVSFQATAPQDAGKQRPYDGRGGVTNQPVARKTNEGDIPDLPEPACPRDQPPSIVGTLLARVLGGGVLPMCVLGWVRTLTPARIPPVRARLHRCAVNCAPRLLVFLTCSLLIFLVAPNLTGVVKAASVGQPASTQLGVTASAGAGHISGQLLDGSRNNAPVTNQSVTLQMAQGNNARDLLSITTDAQGRYAFGALESDSSVQYAVYTLYQGAQYFTDPVSLNKKPDQQINLTVYDATSSTANLAVIEASILIDKPNTQAGTLTISEDFIFENLGDTTYVGAVNGSHGKPNALSFSLPPGARLLSLSTGFNGYTGTQVNRGFASNAAVPPGTSEFAFSFQAPYSGTSYHFAYQAVYPTVSLSLLTPTSFSVIPQQGLTAKGPSNTQSGTYSLFEAQKLSAGKSVQAQLGGLPAPAKTAPAQQSQVNPLLLWLAGLLILLLILAGIGGYYYNTRGHRAALVKRKQATFPRKGAIPMSGKKAATATTKEALLREMLELDKTYEAGKMKKATYQEQRTRLKARLRNLIDEQPKKREEGPTTQADEAQGKPTAQADDEARGKSTAQASSAKAQAKANGEARDKSTAQANGETRAKSMTQASGVATSRRPAARGGSKGKK